MHNLIILMMTVVAFFVAVLNWGRIRKRDIFAPSFIIALVGGVINVAAAAHLTAASPTTFMYVQAVGFSFLITAAGFFLAERARLPGLWPSPATGPDESTPAGRARRKILLAPAGVLLGVAVGFGLWRIGLRGAPGTPEFLRILQGLSAESAQRYAYLLAIQSGFVEEPMYRLFAISATAEALSSAGINRRPRVIAAVLISSLAFGVIPTHNFAVATLVGLLFGVAYLRFGLASMIIAHCVTNAIQLPLLLGLRG